MSPRRSTRLRAASSVAKEALTNGSTPPKVANTGKKRKALQEAVEPNTRSNDAGSSTPKRKKASKPLLPPATPTPAAANLMSAPYSSGDIDDTAPPPRVNRLAVPNGTNATLVTPETHRVIAAKTLNEVSPSKKGSNLKTTASILDDALAHLVKVDPKLKSVIDKHHCHIFSPDGLAEEIDPFRSLISGIISQQVRLTSSTIHELVLIKPRSQEQQQNLSKQSS